MPSQRPPMAQVLGVMLALAAGALSEHCRAPLYPTVDVECSFAGQNKSCDGPQEPGTKASFQCKPLHHFLFDYLPPAGYTSECKEDGQWSVLPFTCVPVCGQPTGRPTALVRNGEKVSSAAHYPWHVAIFDATRDFEQICGGSLITSKFFVSAAHCFFVRGVLRAVSNFKAATGKTDRLWVAPEDVNAQKVDLKEIYSKNYGDRKLQFSNDIALVELQTEFAINAYALPVCVDWALKLPVMQDGELGTVVGYGDTLLKPSKELRFARLPYIPVEKCKKNVTDNLAVFTHLPDKFCVGFVNGATVAQGDSGGGLAFQDEQRTWFLRGVVSVGSPTETTYSLFTNVTAFIPWMASIIQRGEVSGKRCGVDVTESEVTDGAVLDKNNFPWEMDVFYKAQSNRNFSRLWSGVLVEPNLVVSAAVSMSGNSLDVTELPPSWLRVASRRNTESPDLASAAYVSKVRRFHYPGDVYLRTGQLFVFVLLELEKPLKLMPACLDWTGTALLQKHSQGATIVEQNVNASRRSFRRYEIQSPNDCKSRKVKLLDKYNVCTFGKEKLPSINSLSTSLMVSVDNSWYVRGIVSELQQGADQFTAVYTDIGDHDVMRWLSRTKDVIGKPTCGKVNTCEDLRGSKTLPGHMPWNVAIVIESGGETFSAAGVLVQSNAVLTDSARIVVQSVSNQTDSAQTISPANVKIVWTAYNGSSYIASVGKLFAHKSTNLDQGDTTWDLVLLQLVSEVDVMPVCLDLSGLVLQPLESGATGVVESWKSWNDQHSLTASPYVPLVECLQILYNTVVVEGFAVNPREKFCSGPVPDKVEAGAAFMVSTGTYWYLRGMSAGVFNKRAPYVFGLTDLRDGDTISWLSKTLKEIEPPDMMEKEEPPLLDCIGNGISPNECGRYTPFPDGESAISLTNIEHMPWTVEVIVDEKNQGWKSRVGTLVRADIVLTDSKQMVSSRRPNITGDVKVISTSDVVVKWITTDFVDRRITEVIRIHVHERVHGAWVQSAWSVVLLELRTPIPLMPVCLPRMSLQIPSLMEGETGLVESWYSDSSLRAVRPIDFLTDNQCRKLLPNVTDEEFTADRFCAGPVANLTLWTGAPYVARTGNAWFLRGISVYNWGGDNAKRPDLYAFHDISSPEILSWLDDKMKRNFPIPTTTPYVLAVSTTPSPPPMAFVKPFPPIEYAPVRTTTAAPWTTPRTTTTPKPVQCGQLGDVAVPSSVGVQALGWMPWSVAVTLEGPDNNLAWRSGTLVRPNVVITDGTSLVSSRAWNDTGRVHPIETRLLTVVWVSENGGRRRSAVTRLHVHERSFGDRSDFAWDVAVLFLKSSFAGSTACLDLVGVVPPVKSADLGLMDSWSGQFYSGDRFLVRSPFISIKDCKALLPQQRPTQFSPDRLCTGRINASIWDGAGILTEHAGTWFLRGYKAFYWGKDNPDLYGVVSLEEPALRDWLREVLGELF